MTEFRTGPIEPTLVNITDIHSMIYDELKKFSGDTSTIKPPLKIRDNILESPKNYRATYDSKDRLVVVSKFNDWRQADQIAFESMWKQIAYKFDRRKEDHQFIPGNPMGIFALTPYAGLLREEAIEATELLLDDIIDIAGDREIRIARFQNGMTKDPAWWATSRRGFYDTLQFGYVSGTLQQLAIRAPSPVDAATSEA